VAPTAPDTGQASAAATQPGAANINVSVRIASPGDNGGVTQADSATVTVQTSVQSTDTQQSAPTQAATTQTAPSNVNISIRIGSPGADGPVTQTIDANANAGAAPDPQYQQAPSQYQAQSAAPATTQGTPPPSTTAPTPTNPASSSLPASWNWTLTCGDITGGSTTQTIDTGIQGWVWTWTIGSMCMQSSTPASLIQPVNPTESSVGISPPTISPPTPPTLPVAPAIQAPIPPTPPTPPLVQAPIPVVVQGAAVEALPAAATGELSLGSAQAFFVLPAQLEFPQLGPAAPLPLSVSVANARTPIAVTFTTALTAHPVQSRPQTTTSPRHRQAQLPLPVPVPLSLDASSVPASAGTGGGGGTGFAAALVLWLLVQFPGRAVLRLPPGHRTPRPRVDDIRNRPG
jgi:hypothetical protein